MNRQNGGLAQEALTFDDVLLKPGLSDVMPSDADIRTRLTRLVSLNIPILSAAMDTVTRGAARDRDGAGRRHRRHSPQSFAGRAGRARQAREAVRIRHGDRSRDDPRRRDARGSPRGDGPARRFRPSVVESKNGKSGKLVGILTNRDVRFAANPHQPIAELMTKNLITVQEGVKEQDAKKLLHQHRIEKLIVVNKDFHCVGLITVKDIEKAVANPNACKDEQGRLRVAAATTVGKDGFERTERLVDAGVDVVVVDTAHGHSQRVLDAVNRIKRQSNKVQVLAGNIATPRGWRRR